MKHRNVAAALAALSVLLGGPLTGCTPAPGPTQPPSHSDDYPRTSVPPPQVHRGKVVDIANIVVSGTTYQIVEVQEGGKDSPTTLYECLAIRYLPINPQNAICPLLKAGDTITFTVEDDTSEDEVPSMQSTKRVTRA